MRNGRAVDWDNPLLGHGHQSPCECLGPDPRTTSGPAVVVPRKQAGHMTCTRPSAERQILLAMRASSTHDPMYALQEVFVDPIQSCIKVSDPCLERVPSWISTRM